MIFNEGYVLQLVHHAMVSPRGEAKGFYIGEQYWSKSEQRFMPPGARSPFICATKLPLFQYRIHLVIGTNLEEHGLHATCHLGNPMTAFINIANFDALRPGGGRARARKPGKGCARVAQPNVEAGGGRVISVS